MQNETVSIGIDSCDDTYFVARVDNHSGRPDIKALIRFDSNHFNGHHLLEGNKIIVSLPDNQTTIKHLRISESEDAKLKVQFEMETAQLEKSNNFVYDVIPTQLENYYLGLSFRIKTLQSLLDPFVKQNGDNSYTTGGMMRAVALANGYLSFCQQSGGEFGAIIDFGKQSASVAFFYQEKIVDVASLPVGDSFKSDEKLFHRALTELKTFLNYKISGLREKGLSVPLSRLLVPKDLFADNQLDMLKNVLKVEITFPEIHSGFISESNKNQEIPLNKYLVALGLTVV